MIQLKNITLKNFLSIGAVTQGVNFDSKQLTLIIGENLDMGENGARNGTGKTTLIQGLSYALYGTPLNNIRKDNLVNRTNGKHMLVTLDFSVNGVDYRIERGRKPNVLKFYMNDNELEESQNSAQGEMRQTQTVIEQTIGMSQDMFKHIVALNTYSEPFLAMRSNDQRMIIEQLLGITLLSEKAEVIKEKIRLNKDDIQQEEFRIKAIEEANKRVQDQIDSLKRRQNLWNVKHKEDLNKLSEDYKTLAKIDIDAEILAHKELSEWQEKKRLKDSRDSLLARETSWSQKRDKDIVMLQTEHDKKSHIDIDVEIKAHKDKVLSDQLKKSIKTLESSLKKEETLVDKLSKEIATLEENKCYACGQDFHDENHDKVLASKRDLLSSANNDLAQTANDLEKNKNDLELLGKIPKTHYATEEEAYRHSSELESLMSAIDQKREEKSPYLEQIEELEDVGDIGSAPVTVYDTETEAIEHRSTIESLLKQIESKSEETDPYVDQVKDMESEALQEISFDKINQLTHYGDHLKFLLDILTSKDSFVRKKIIDQNLAYLNSRLTHYLDKLGLPHTVIFKNDLSVEITELGRELDFHNLSRGEMNRVILALSWAFRDVWENLYCPINVMFIDEVLDNGTDSIGVENSLAVLKDINRSRQKSIWLVSHKDDLASRVNSILKVYKEQGFTTYDIATEMG